VKVFLLAGLLEIALGVAFLAAQVPRAEIPHSNTGDANIGMQATRSERASPIISFILIGSGITLLVANARSGRRKPDRSETPGDLEGPRGETQETLRLKHAPDCAMRGGHSQSNE